MSLLRDLVSQTSPDSHSSQYFPQYNHGYPYCLPGRLASVLLHLLHMYILIQMMLYVSRCWSTSRPQDLLSHGLLSLSATCLDFHPHISLPLPQHCQTIVTVHSYLPAHLLRLWSPTSDHTYQYLTLLP